MRLRRFPFLVATGLGIILHGCIFIWLCQPFATSPMGSDPAAITDRENLARNAVAVIVLGALVADVWVAVAYNRMCARESRASLADGALGTLVSSEVARLAVAVIAFCCSLAGAIQYIDTPSAAEDETYKRLLAPLVPGALEFPATLLTAPLAALVGFLLAKLTTRSAEAA